MKTSANGIAVLHHFEGCRLESYPDPATGGKPYTVGWGCTGPDVVPGMTITQSEADKRFEDKLSKEFEPGVLNAVQRNMTQGQFDAFVCLSYNIGLGNFRGSTLIRRFNIGDIPVAAGEFLRWNRAAGQVMRGLTRRRYSEQALYNGHDGDEAIHIGITSA